MLTGLELLVLAGAVLAVMVAAAIVRALWPFLVNTVTGLVALYVVYALIGLEVAITPIALAIVAIGGLPGAAVVLGLAVFGIAFVP